MHLNSVPIHNRIEHLFHDSWISFDVLSFFQLTRAHSRNTVADVMHNKNKFMNSSYFFLSFSLRRAKKTHLHELTLGFDRFVNSFASSLWTIHLIFILMTVEQKKENIKRKPVARSTLWYWMDGWLVGWRARVAWKNNTRKKVID